MGERERELEAGRVREALDGVLRVRRDAPDIVRVRADDDPQAGRILAREQCAAVSTRSGAISVPVQAVVEEVNGTVEMATTVIDERMPSRLRPPTAP